MPTQQHPKRRVPSIGLPADVLAAIQSIPLVLAVSGGGDSMAMLRLIQELHMQQRIAGPVIVAHFNHAARQPFADEAEQLVHDYCIAHALELILDHQPVHATRPRGTGYETWLRDIRHDFLHGAAKSRGAHLLLAHNSDDLVESFLLHVFRGAGLHGLTFPLVDRSSEVTVVRPVGHVSRADLRTYAEHNAIPFLDDPLNEEPCGDRNRLRHGIIPTVENALVRRISGPIRACIDHLSAVQDYITEQTNEYLAAEQYTDRLDAPRLAETHKALRSSILQAWLQRQKVSATNEQWSLLTRLAGQTHRTPKRIPLGSDPAVVCVIDQHTVALAPVAEFEMTVEPSEPSTIATLSVDGSVHTYTATVTVGTGSLRLTLRLTPATPGAAAPSNIFFRTCTEGDRISEHRTLLRMLMTDGVPAWKRRSLWIAVDDAGTVWGVQDQRRIAGRLRGLRGWETELHVSADAS